MVWCIFWVWNVAMKKMYEKELWNLLRTNASLFYFDAPSTKITTPLGGKSTWTPEFTPLNKLLCMKKTLALQSINNELNSELTYQYKDSNRINTWYPLYSKFFLQKHIRTASLLRSGSLTDSKKMYKTIGVRAGGARGAAAPPNFGQLRFFGQREKIWEIQFLKTFPCLFNLIILKTWILT